MKESNEKVALKESIELIKTFYYNLLLILRIVDLNVST